MSSPSDSSRIHSLDALRAFAMLLGIALHAALAYGGTPWMVMDNATSTPIRWFYESVHCFRMQLFFFVSGLFTMLLWRKRGWSALFEQRFQRLVVPMLLAYVTILPLLSWVSTKATDDTIKTVLTNLTSTSLVQAIRNQQREEVGRLLATGADPNQLDNEFGITPLGWAALVGDTAMVQMLIEGGANIHVRDRNGFTPLHQATFLGRVEVTRLLLDAGADLNARSNDKKSAQDTAEVSWFITRALCTLLKINAGDQKTVQENRKACLQLLEEYRERRGASLWNTLIDRLNEYRNAYGEWLRGSGWSVRFSPINPPVHLFLTPLLAHLWFLWFLCWYVVLFLLMAPLYSLFPQAVARAVMLPGCRLLWLVPLTLGPQLFQGVLGLGLGPDTSSGVLPWPHVLAYYSVFFFAGALYFDAHDREGRFGRWWWLWLPVAAVLFALSRHYLGDPIVTGVFQVLFSWSAIFGWMGLFRVLMPGESFAIRFLSDSAYWLYLSHLPLVIWLQRTIRDWDYSAEVKFVGITIGSTLVLLLSYAVFVRYTYLGTILNGPRRKHLPAPVKGVEKKEGVEGPLPPPTPALLPTPEPSETISTR
ncbi:MAG: acyltransferase family protein [Gemmataceae bacterium]